MPGIAQRLADAFERARCELSPMWLTISPSSMIWRIDMRGLSEAKGSWKTICMRERSGRISRRSLPWIGSPSKKISPPWLAIRRISAWPKVVLPEPDSPTRPSVSWRWRLEVEVVDGDQLEEIRLEEAAALEREGDAGPRVPSSMVGLSAASGLRDALRLGGEQVLGVGVLRIGEHLLGAVVLLHLAVLHHIDVVGELADDGQVVGDEDHRHAVLGLEVLDQVEDLGLHGDVERGGRLVGDQHVGAVGERHGDHHALALAAGELVRILAQPRRRLGDLHFLEQRVGARHRLRAAHLGCGGGGSRQICWPIGIDRVQRAHRLLEDHRDVVAAELAHLASDEREDVLAGERDAGVAG